MATGDADPPSSLDQRRMTVYFVRHAEAAHNIKEREAVQAAIAKGQKRKSQHDIARKKVLRSLSLWDAPLSAEGTLQARESSETLAALTSHKDSKYRPPTLVLVSPLRRALMTATECFLDVQPSPKFFAIEALREKRTGLACDEKSSIDSLRAEFPHVDFSDLEKGIPSVPIGEDNPMVKERARTFLEERFALVQDEFVAIVSHKGWLRELRHTLKEWVDEGKLVADFDLEEWHQTLYGNAEVRVAECIWRDRVLQHLISRSLDNAILSLKISEGEYDDDSEDDKS